MPNLLIDTTQQTYTKYPLKKHSKLVAKYKYKQNVIQLENSDTILRDYLLYNN